MFGTDETIDLKIIKTLASFMQAKQSADVNTKATAVYL
jgi:hypothetical protein